MVNRFKPLLDAFQGSYKDKYYYWVAVHLALRSFLFAFYAFPKLKLILSTLLLIVFGIYRIRQNIRGGKLSRFSRISAKRECFTIETFPASQLENNYRSQ